MFFSSRLNLIKRVGFGEMLFMGMIPIWMNKYVFEGWNHQSMVFWPRNPKHICMTWSCLWFTVSVRVRMCWCIVVVERDASWTFKVYRYSRNWYLKFLQLDFFWVMLEAWKFLDVFGFSFWFNVLKGFPKSKIYWHLPNLDILEHDSWQAPAHWSQHCWWPQPVASSPYGQPSDGCVNGDQGCWRIPCNSCFSYIFAVLCWRSELWNSKSWKIMVRFESHPSWMGWWVEDFWFQFLVGKRMFRWCWSAAFYCHGPAMEWGRPKNSTLQRPRWVNIFGKLRNVRKKWERPGSRASSRHLR